MVFGPGSPSGGMVRLNVTHSHLAQQFDALAFDCEQSVLNIKRTLMPHVGTEPKNMHLVLLDKKGAVVADMGDDAALLHTFKPSDGMYIHVNDLDPVAKAPSGGEPGLVEKMHMAETAAEMRGTKFAGVKANLPAGVQASLP
jgi:hypothetical protein